MNIENTYVCFAANGKVCSLNLNENKKELRTIFAQKSLKINTNDSKNLYTVFSNICDIPLVEFDTSLAGYLCSPSANSYDINRLAEEYLPFNVRSSSEAYPTKLAR